MIFPTNTERSLYRVPYFSDSIRTVFRAWKSGGSRVPNKFKHCIAIRQTFVAAYRINPLSLQLYNFRYFSKPQ